MKRFLPKRSLLPQTANKQFKEVVPDRIKVVPEVEGLLESALSVMGVEIARLQQLVLQGVHLDNKESRILNGYVESLVKASKEMREIRKDGEDGALSDEELLEQAKAAVNILESKIQGKENDDVQESTNDE